MDEKEIKYFTSQYLDEKIQENSNYIRCTFYDIRVKNNLSEIETEVFLNLSKKYLENNGFSVFLTGESYMHENIEKTVQSNELMIAVK